MKTKITTAIIAICLSAGAMAQEINYGAGLIAGRSELYAVTGVELFDLFPKQKVKAGGVTFTPMGGVTPESPVYVGAEAKRSWEQPQGHRFVLGVSALTELGNGWSRIDDLKLGFSLRVERIRF